MLAPACLVVQVHRGEIVGMLAVTAGLGFRRAPAESAARQPQRGAREGESGLGLDRQHAAERIQSEHRIRSGQEMRCRHGIARDQVPVDHVAERLVHAHAVHEHRQALRQPEQRRRGEAAVIEALLERIGLRVV